MELPELFSIFAITKSGSRFLEVRGARNLRGERSEERDMLYALLNSPPFGGVGGGCLGKAGERLFLKQVRVSTRIEHQQF